MINSNQPYYKIKDLAYDLDMTISELRNILVSLEVLEQRSNGSKKHFLLTKIALKYGVGEIRHKPYGCCRQEAPYNIYYTTEIKKVLVRNIPLSDWNSNIASDGIPIMQVKVNEEPRIEAMNSSYNINIDIDLKDTKIINSNSTIDISEDMKEDWLWQEYYSKQQVRMQDVIW